MEREIYRGDVYYADLRPVIGSEQGGIRPVVILQNDMGNQYSPTVIVAAITSQYGKHRLPTHIRVIGYHYGLRSNSIILLEQLRTIDKERLGKYIGRIGYCTMRRVDRAIAISLGLSSDVVHSASI